MSVLGQFGCTGVGVRALDHQPIRPSSSQRQQGGLKNRSPPALWPTGNFNQSAWDQNSAGR